MYAKLFSSITESSLWSEPKEVRLLFVTMLAKADQTGFVEASVPGLARVANLTVEETVTALSALQNPDPFSKNPDNEGRRIAVVPRGFMLLNYEEYRSRRNVAERQEYMRKYMREYRKQPVNTVNTCKPPLDVVSRGEPPLAHTEADTETEAENTAGAVIPPSEAKPRSSERVSPPLADIVDAVDKITGTKSRWTAKRKIAAKLRWMDEHWRSHWREAAERARESAFLSGRNDRGWVMDLEFFLRPDTVTKILEGKYDDREGFCETSEQKRERANAGVFDRLQAAADRTLARLGSSNADAAPEPGAIVFDEASGLPY